MKWSSESSRSVVGVDQDGVEERRRDVPVQQPIAILREGRRRPHRVVDPQAHEPAKQQVVIQLLHQLPLAADGVERLQQQRAQQPLRRNRRAPEMDIQPAQLRREAVQGAIGDAPNRPERMIAGDPLLERHIAEHRPRLLVGSTHRLAPFVSRSIGSTPGSTCRSPLSYFFSNLLERGSSRRTTVMRYPTREYQ